MTIQTTDMAHLQTGEESHPIMEVPKQKKRRRLFHKTVLIPVILLLGAGIVYAVFHTSDTGPVYDTLTLAPQNVVQEIGVTGRVKSREQVDLAFEEGGTVASVYVAVGDVVAHGQSLVALQNESSASQVAQAEASQSSAEAQLAQLNSALKIQRVKLDQLRSGYRTQEIYIAELAVNRAEQTLASARNARENVVAQSESDVTNAYAEIPVLVNDASVQADDAFQNKIRGIFNDTGSSSPQISFLNTDFSAEIDAENRYFRAHSAYLHLEELSKTIGADRLSRSNALRDAKADVLIIRDFLSRVLDVTNASVGEDTTILDGYRAGASSARANMIATYNALDARERVILSQNIQNETQIDGADASVYDAERALASARAELDLKRAGTRTEEIAVQEAYVSQAEANISVQRAVIRQAVATVQERKIRLKKQTLASPIDGIVTAVEAHVGEIVPAGSLAVRVMTADGMEVESFIPEVDITKVTVGNTAEITLDAYGRDVAFMAVVVQIDPAETMLDGVATYRAIFRFDENDARVRSGMTANVDVQGETRENVLAVPQRAIIRKDGLQIVRVLRDGVPVDVTVVTGLRGSDGFVEIVEGLSEGDVVIRFIEE
ncbi:MAG: efflux RND transporter periplasmic adaptor subunit [bacterium]|nr:efflux RND transporter periplasmic adaptor subunit [bacterium]